MYDLCSRSVGNTCATAINPNPVTKGKAMIHRYPSPGSPARLAPFLALVSCLVLLGGCGKKTPPIPPQLMQPAPIQDLQYRIDGKDALISWSFPSRALGGSPITQIESFDFERAVAPVEDFCDGCPVAFGPPVTIAGGALPDTGGRMASYRETDIKPGHIYFYRVRSRLSRWFASQPTAILSFTYDIAPATITDVTVTALDGMARVSWGQPTTLANGDPMVDAPVYQLFRSEGEEPFTLLTDNVPVYVTTYFDGAVSNGRSYRYQVRALRRVGATRLAGAFSNAVSVMPVDRTPPPAPESVTAFHSPAGVRIMWITPMSPDIAGFRLYRRAAQGKKELLDSLSGATNEYLDNGPFLGSRTWLYTVTTLDRAQPPNESGPSPEARIDLPE